MSNKPQDVTYWQNRKLNDDERDWGYKDENWVKDYVKSADHPHRQVIIDFLKTFDWSYLLELGSSSGPNLIRIHEAFPTAALFAIEANSDSVEEAKRVLPVAVDVQVGDMNKTLPFADGYFDVVLADASLMYIDPENINKVMDEISRVARKSVIIVERFAETDEITGHVWGRNYTKLLAGRGFHVKEVPVTKELWPTSINWQKYGKFFLATR